MTLTQEDIHALKLIPSYQLKFSSSGCRWQCQGLHSAYFPTAAEAMKSLANIAKAGELTGSSRQG